MQPCTTINTFKTLFHPACDEPALTAEIAALWGAFLHEGLMDSLATKRDRQILGHWKMGCIELMIASCAYLPCVWEEAYKQWDSSELYDGIFEYEVLSVLGSYLGDYIVLNNGKLPPKEDVEALIQTLVYCFLENSTASQHAI
jgi:hypothetical protein